MKHTVWSQQSVVTCGFWIVTMVRDKESLYYIRVYITHLYTILFCDVTVCADCFPTWWFDFIDPNLNLSLSPASWFSLSCFHPLPPTSSLVFISSLCFTYLYLCLFLNFYSSLLFSLLSHTLFFHFLPFFSTSLSLSVPFFLPLWQPSPLPVATVTRQQGR